MKTAYVIIIGAIVCLLCTIAPARAQDDDNKSLMVSWSYPYNNSTYRIYSGYLAQITAISELGNDWITFENDQLQLDVITLYGDVDTGDVYVRRIHPTCWRVEMVSDYLLLRRTWKANEEFDGKCYQYYFPFSGGR